MLERKWTNKTFIELTKVGCAALLVAAPWTFGFDSAGAATWNACLNGAAIAIAALAALAHSAQWPWWQH